jgi:hypothetical protein
MRAEHDSLEIGVYHKPYLSKIEACVEAGAFPVPGGLEVRVRNSRNPGGPVLAFTPAEWEAFTGSVRTCTEFDLPPGASGGG